MSDENPPEELPQTQQRRSVLPNLVWAVPLAALIIVAYLGFQALSHKGEVVTVTFDRAAGARAGDTKVLYQGADAGRLIKIQPNKDGHSLDFKLRLIPEAKQGLNSNARFWLIGATPNLTDLSSLKAVVSGVAIGYAPGEGGTPTDKFQGLEQAPAVLPSDKGTRFHMRARALNSLREGSVVLFHGQSIGKVSQLKFDGREAFNLEVFIFEPFDSLITTETRFWKISPLRLSFRDGITASFAPLGALLAGGIEISVESDERGAAKATADTAFFLYESHNAARQGLSGPSVRYTFSFSQAAAGTLAPDAPVTLLGFEIGEVHSVRLAFDERSGEPYAIATADIYPQQLRLDGASPGGSAQDSAAAWRSATDAKLRQLARAGFRAQLQQRPAFVGDESIVLVKTKGAALADLKQQGAMLEFPAADAGSDFSELGSQASRLLANLNSIPFNDIGANLRTISDRLRQVLTSPKTENSLQHLNSTLASVDKILSDAEPQVGPLLEKLKETATELSGVTAEAHQLLRSNGDAEEANLHDAIQQLTEAARSIRSLTDYLSRHPEALIRGKRPSP